MKRGLDHRPCEVSGTVLRSTLEGRWATFFNTAGFKWAYEPKTFSLPRGGKYTPDFHVEGLGWIEVKPSLEYLRESWNRIKPFLKLHPDSSLCLFAGDGVSFREVIRFCNGNVQRPGERDVFTLMALIRRGSNNDIDFNTVCAMITRAMEAANTCRISHTVGLQDCVRFTDCLKVPYHIQH